MSMQQALGAVGFVVGAYFGYPQLGFVVGSLVGAALTPAQKVEGPRIDDQKVTVSTEGAGIPRFWGTGRFGGNVVESTDKMEVAKTESQGKGGGGVDSTTYHYYVNMRTILCEAREGDTYAIRKIWQDGKLVYDSSSGVSVGAALASAENQTSRLILYQGQENQLPDPTEEARYGVGNVPAYRGVVSVVINDVECPGGRVPQFSYELAANPVRSSLFTESAPFVVPLGNYVTSISTSRAPAGTDVITVFSEDGDSSLVGLTHPKSVSVYQLGVDFMELVGTSVIEDASYNYTAIPGSADIDAICYRWFDTDGVDKERLRIWGEGSTASFLTGSLAGFAEGASFWSKAGDTVAFIGQDEEHYAIFTYGGGLLASGACAPLSTCYLSDVLWIVSRNETSVDEVMVSVRDKSDGVEATAFALPSQFQLGESRFYAEGDRLWAWWQQSPGSQATVWRFAATGDAEQIVDDVITTFRPVMPAVGVNQRFVSGVSIEPISEGSEVRWFMWDFMQIAVSPVAVNKIVSDECMLAGLEAEQFDVSSIAEMVHGYTISNPASARAGIQPLLTAFAIDATDEDESLQFFNRSDKVSVATVPYDELGCVEDGSEPGDPMPLTRANVTELYRSVTVSYINPAFDYQTSTEPARRQITGATVEFNAEIAIAMSSDQAATAAHRILYDNHNDRNRRIMKLSRRFAYLSAGDVTTVEYPRGTVSDWRLVQVTDTGALVEVEAVPANAELYAQTAVGGTGHAGQVVAALASPQRLELGDMPILQDGDNNAGIYAFMEPFSGAPGAELFVGDDDSSLLSRGAVNNAATIGFVEGVLGDFSANIMDERNTMIVSIGEGTLSSTTRYLLYTSTQNSAAIGVNGRWELLQFLRASSLGGGRYLLSGLRRGLRGTERNRSNHQTLDTFVLLGLAGTIRPSMDVGSIGFTRSYRAVSKGRSFDSASSIRYANTAEGLSPFSPWNARKTVDVSNDQTLSWQRRTRMSSNALRGVVPLGEATEAYAIDFYTSDTFSALAGTRNSTSRSIVLTSAEQAAMGLTPGATLYVRIYQLSESVGRGAPLEAEI